MTRNVHTWRGRRTPGVIAHLLKTQHQPERATPSWRDTIVEQAVSIDEVLLASPSLRRELPTFIAYAYPRACRLAAKETGMPLSTFPKMPTPAFEAALAAELVEEEPEAD